MNAALAKLYQDVILTHHRQPQHFGPLPDATQHARLVNPLCGDEVTVSVCIAAETISACHFEGHGCALCRASASLLTVSVRGQSVQQARALGQTLLTFLQQEEDSQTPEGIGDLVALSGVREHPSRRRCATLPWEALLRIVDDQAAQ